MAVRCQQDLLSPSQTCRVFESDLPCFESELPGGFLSQIFRVLTQSLSGFFGLSFFGFFWVFLYFDSVLPIYWVSPSLFWVVHFVFWLSPSHFFGSDLHYFDSVLPIHWVSSSLFCVSISRFWKSNFLSE